jgi:hypothetical protein
MYSPIPIFHIFLFFFQFSAEISLPIIASIRKPRNESENPEMSNKKMYSISTEFGCLQDEEWLHDDERRHEDRFLDLTLLDWWSSLNLLCPHHAVKRSVIVPHFE